MSHSHSHVLVGLYMGRSVVGFAFLGFDMLGTSKTISVHLLIYSEGGEIAQLVRAQGK